MDEFTISQVARYSGIKPHTIRMWEQRYNALNPLRTSGNTRIYSNEELRRLLNIVSLLEYDYKVSELCVMSDQKLFNLISQTKSKAGKDGKNEYSISQLIAAGMSYDENYFEKVFSNCLLRLGMKQTYIKVIYPALIRLGLMWTTNELPPSHEHFISNLIRQKILTAIDSLPPPEQKSEKWLLFLPEDEFHEMGLLFANYFIRFAGKKVIYLGSNIPLQSLVVAVDDSSPDNLLLFLVKNDLSPKVYNYLDELINRFGNKNIYVSANKKLIDGADTGKGVIWLKSVKELERKL